MALAGTPRGGPSCATDTTSAVPVSTTDLRERVRRLPGVERLLPALDGLPPVYLVGGTVRDLLLDLPAAAHLDLAVEGDARSVARALAERLGGAAREYERFGTAVVELEGFEYDMASTRRETYDEPGALPRVEQAPLADDLRRRDFTLNAMAIGLKGDDLGHLYDPHGGLSDLEAGLLRVLHDRSFADDPTRLLRGVRFEARLGFRFDPDTEVLAREAVGAEALGTVSADRTGRELVKILEETEAPAAVKRLKELEIHTALHPALDPDPEQVASAALGAVTLGANRVTSELAALVVENPQELDLWVAALPLEARDRDAVARAARVAPRLCAALREREHTPSELRELLGSEPKEALALALALGAPAEPVLRWATALSAVGLEIGGDDLLEAGVPEGPAIGRALEGTLRRKLDGLVDGRDEELETALALARSERA
jgi:tRNA nucleotidyltransferase (CCA-adding enzyme)